jgi:hypothetical protein
MAQGTHSDYAGIHLSGRIRVLDRPAEEGGPRLSCWDHPGPWRRGLEQWVLDRTTRLGATLHPNFRPGGQPPRYSRASIWLARRLSGRLGLDGRIGEDRLVRPSPIGRARPGDRPIALIPDPPATTPLAERFMGVTSVVWNEKRSVTLVADGPVEMLLVKRRALMEIIERCPEFYQMKIPTTWGAKIRGERFKERAARQFRSTSSRERRIYHIHLRRRHRSAPAAASPRCAARISHAVD